MTDRLKIYFAGAIRGGRADQELYHELIRHLRQFGEVLTEHVGDHRLDSAGEEGLSDLDIFQRDLAWLHQADILVAEVSTPSLGVGYEIARAEALEMPTLCLYRDENRGRLSAMIAGNPRLTIRKYRSRDDLFSVVDDFCSHLPAASGKTPDQP